MKVLVVDDEPAARARLAGLLAEIDPGIAVAGEAGDGGEALRLIAATAPDLVLLDVCMPKINGLDAARAIARLERPPAVVFVTAHDDYAVAAFEVSAVDYLLKPVRKERLEAALGKARRFSGAAWGSLVANLPAERQPARSHLCVYGQGELRLIEVAKVVYFRADSKYTTVRVPDGELLIEDSLVALEREFGDKFLRVHRNALAAGEKLLGLSRAAMGGWRLRLAGIAESLEVSRRHLPAVRVRLRDRAEARGRD